MPGGIGPVNATTMASRATRDRAIAAVNNANEIFFNLDSRRVYYDSSQGYLYFVAEQQELVVRTIRAAFGGRHRAMVIEQLHLDSHRFFNGARRVGLIDGQADTLLIALRLSGLRATVR